jgi:FkbM family methyltransferase
MHQKFSERWLNKAINFLSHRLPDGRFRQIAYAQEAEDIFLMRRLGQQQTGFFVDIGAHHPFRFSNTFAFYKRGWRGINLDADPLSIQAFEQYRPDDINLNLAIGEASEGLIFYRFNEPALNTFSPTLAAQRAQIPLYKIIEEVKIPMQPLAPILNIHMPPNTQIDFMTIDVEGWDLAVLKTNDWEKFRPRYLVVESLIADLTDLTSCPIYQFLATRNYKIESKLDNSALYRDLLLC